MAATGIDECGPRPVRALHGLVPVDVDQLAPGHIDHRRAGVAMPRNYTTSTTPISAVANAAHRFLVMSLTPSVPHVRATRDRPRWTRPRG